LAPGHAEVEHVGPEAVCEEVQSEGGGQVGEDPATLRFVLDDRKFISGPVFRTELLPGGGKPDADDDGGVEVGRRHRYDSDSTPGKVSCWKYF